MFHTDKPIFILAGDFREVQYYAMQHGLRPEGYVYVFDEYQLAGARGNGKDFLLYGTWYTNEKADQIIELAKARGFNIREV